MLIVTRAKLRFLTAGHQLTVPNDGQHRKGRVYALRTPTAKRAVCHVEIVAATATELQIRLASDSPRLLAVRSEYGYTDRPALALREEPEAIGDVELKRMTDRARQQAQDELAAFKARTIADVDELAQTADRRSRQRLRNVRRIADSL